MSTHSDNEVLLREAFDAVAVGDHRKFVNLYADDLIWAGFGADGLQHLYTKSEFLKATAVIARLDEAVTEIVATRAVGEEMVVADTRVYRRVGDTVLDTLIVMVHRFENGKVTRGADVCPLSFERFWVESEIVV